MRHVRFLKDHPPHQYGDVALVSVGDCFRMEAAGIAVEIRPGDSPAPAQEQLNTTDAPEPENRDPETPAPAHGRRNRKRV